MASLHLPVEIDAFFRELPVAVVWIFVGLVLHHLHPFAPVALLMAVLADHVQLPDAVLPSKTESHRQL